MGFYDIPAMTSFILKETGQPQLSYVGHSMGTTMFFVFCSTRPELQSRIRQMHALAPIAFMSRMKSPIRKVAPYARLLQVRPSQFLQNLASNLFLQMSMTTMKQYECFAHGTPMGYLEMEIIRLTNIEAKSYEAMVGALVGPDPEQVNKVREDLNYVHPKKWICIAMGSNDPG
jgi:pimeloyl-ACP methyl ester carboxylesterase